MYYIEVLRTWRVWVRYLIVLAGLFLLGAIFFAWHRVGSGDETRYSMGGHAVVVGFICLLFASISGLSLSRHLDHLDFALTKPRSRAAFAATILGIDVLGLTAFFITTAVAFWLFHVVLGETHGIVFDDASWYGIAIAFGGMLAWYALVQALSCARGAASWAIAGLFVSAVSLEVLSLVSVGPGLQGLVAVLNLVNPIAYFSTVPFYATDAASGSLVVHSVLIYLVAAVAAFAALARWQRVEM